MKFFAAAFPLFLVLFLDGMGLGLVFPMLNSILIDPAASFLPPATSDEMRNFLYGLTVGIFMICWFFGAAILGDLSDTIGRRKSLLICLLGGFLGYFFSALGVVFRSMTILIIGRLIAGFTSGSQAIAQAAIVDLSTPETKNRNIGLILLAVSIGFIVGPMLRGILSSSTLVSWFSFSTPFYFAAVLSLLNAVFLYFFFKETFVKKGKVVIHFHHAIQIFISAFKHPKIRFLSLFFLFFILGWSNYYTYISMFLFKRYGFSPLEVTFFMALLGLGFSIGFGFLPNYSAKKLGLKGSVILGIVVGAFSILITVAASKASYAWLTVIPIGIFISVAYSNGISLFSNQVDAESQGWVMGITGSIMALCFGVVGLLSWLINKFSPGAPLVISYILLFLSALIVYFYQRVKQIHRPED